MTGSTQTRAGPGLAATAASGAEFQRLDPATGLVASTAPASGGARQFWPPAVPRAVFPNGPALRRPGGARS